MQYMVDVSLSRFEELVAQALDDIPEPLAARMDNVVVLVAEQPEMDDLVGLYEGVPLTERADYGMLGRSQGGLVLPDRITLYRVPLCEQCETEEELVEQVRITVFHEVAHYFGIDDDRLEELGWA